MIGENNKILDGRFVFGSLICWLAVFGGIRLCMRLLKTKVSLFYVIDSWDQKVGKYEIAMVLEIGMGRGKLC